MALRARLAAWIDRTFWPGLDEPRQPCLTVAEVIAGDDQPAGAEWLYNVPSGILIGVALHLRKDVDDLSKHDIRENYEHGERWANGQRDAERRVDRARSLRASLC